jgi:hypothetical protein
MKLIELIYSHFRPAASEDLLPGINYATCERYMAFLRSQDSTLHIQIRLLKEFSKFLKHCVGSYTYCKIDGDQLVFYTLDSQEELLESATFKPIFLSEALVRLETFKHSQTLGIPLRHSSTIELLT